MLLVFFLSGLIVGSFLNVVIFRLESKTSLFWSRSRCRSCRHELSTFDLIPLISFVFLAGRCRYCGKGISLQYPLVELATGLLFAGVEMMFDQSFDRAFWIYFVSSFVVLIVYDLKYQLVPDAIIWPLVSGAVVYRMLPALMEGSWQISLQYVLAGLITGGFILMIVLVTKEKAMGMGDVPIAFLHGIILGYTKGLFALGWSFVLGAAVGGVLLISGRAGLKTAIPFTPFLIMGLLTFIFWDPPLLLVGFSFWE